MAWFRRSVVGILTLVAAALWNPGLASAAEGSKPKILFLTHSGGFKHGSLATAEKTMIGLGRRSGLFDVVTLQGYKQERDAIDLSMIDADYLAQFPDLMELKPFTPSDMYEFLTRWPFGRHKGAQVTRIHNALADRPTLREMCTNPLVLSMYVADDLKREDALIPDTRTEFYETITEAAPENAIEFYHGYTFSGHPAACAAGIVVQDIFQKEQLFDRARDLSDYFLDGLFDLKDLDAVRDIRGYGLLGAIEIKAKDGPR